MHIYYNKKFICFGEVALANNTLNHVKVSDIASFDWSPEVMIPLLDSVDFICCPRGAEELVLSAIKKNFKHIKASGGLVRGESGRALMIFRGGKWDLPKGKRESGENSRECALREVEEECGISGLLIREKICNTYHIYSTSKHWVLKKTSWYGMSGSEASELTPQTAEDISQVVWVSDAELESKLCNTYPSVLEVFDNE